MVMPILFPFVLQVMKMNRKFVSEKALRLTPYVWGKQLQDDEILKLNTNENPYPPSEKALEAIRSHLGKELTRYPDPLNREIKETLSTYYRIQRDQIFVGNGSDDVLSHMFQAFFNPGDPVIVLATTYGFYKVLADLYDIELIESNLKDDFSVNIQDFTRNSHAVLLANPNAPTGIYLPLSTVENIVQANPDQLVIIDEAYIDFGGESAIHLIQKYENLCVIQTCSKSRGLANLRIGFMFAQSSLIEAMHRIRDCVNPYNMDVISMAAASAAFRDEAYFRKTTKEIIETREWFSAQLTRCGFTVLPSMANFVFISCPAMNGYDLYDGLRQQKILVRYFAQPAINKFVRISIGTRPEMETVYARLMTLTKGEK